MELKNQLVSNYSFLEKMDKKSIEKVMESIIINEYEVGHKLFSSIQTCTGFSFILKGKVRVYRIGEDGKEITLYRIGKGDSCFNTILCMLTESENYSFAEVEENATLALVPMDIFREYILNNTDFLRYIFGNLYNKFEGVVEGLESVTFTSIDDRLKSYFSKNLNGKSKGTIYTTHEKIAADIGSSREVVSRSLKSLEKSGIVQLSRGKIKIL